MLPAAQDSIVQTEDILIQAICSLELCEDEHDSVVLS